jgi:GcrA cell cycle regulator
MWWSDARTEQLRQLWADGLSAGAIAIEIDPRGGMTRNAVIGKVHRLGLPPRKVGRRQWPGVPRKRSPRRVQIKPSRPKWDVENEVLDNDFSQPHVDETSTLDAAIPKAQRKSLMELTPGTCKWGVGDVGTPEFFFCGAPTVKGQPYCGPHCKRAFAGVRRVVPPEESEISRRALLRRVGKFSQVA